MSAKTYDAMRVDDLVNAYVRLATSLGSLWSRRFKPAERTPERVEMSGALGALGAELRARKPIEKLGPLFDHENVDVRFHAACRSCKSIRIGRLRRFRPSGRTCRPRT